MSISWCAVLAWMTRWLAAFRAGTYWPLVLVVPATMVGATRTPPFAIVAYTLAICTAVTATPWPNAIVYRVSPDHCDTG